MDLKNAVTVISGGASGLGLALAEHFTANGARVAVLDKHIPAQSEAHLRLQCDVTDESATEEAFRQIQAELGLVQICINCAGIAPAAKVVGKQGPQSLADFKQVINVNLIGTFNVMRLAATQMQQAELTGSERGVIINTASIAATEGQIGQAAYSASKGGVAAMTVPVAREMAKWGIRVNCVAPGVFKTPMMAAMPDEVQEQLAESIPFPKRLGAPEEFARLCQHIAENTYLNAEIIRLDAGLRMA